MSMPRPMRCSRTRGKKGDRHQDPDDPPRRRANKRRGHGNYENDRPPIVGSVGRETGEVRLRVERYTDRKTLLTHVHGYTAIEATLYTDEWRAYEKAEREHRTVSHGIIAGCNEIGLGDFALWSGALDGVPYLLA